MITLITGVPGSGKSLYAVKFLLDALDLKKKAQQQLPKLEEEGNQDKIAACRALIRDIYTDIAGFDHDRFGTKPSPDDWRDTPDGSLVMYDECQKMFGPDGSGRSKDTRVQSLETHRHSGHDIYFITQRERLLHSHIRDLVGRHYHIQRQYGSHNVKIFRRDECIDTKSKSVLNACDSFIWRYEKRLFDCYKSATIHTHKLTLPSWLKKAAFILLVFVALSGYLFYSSWGFFTSGTASLSSDYDTDHAQVGGRTQVDMIEVTKAPRSRLMGCVVWADRTECRCHDVNGHVAEYLTFSQCIHHAEGSTLNFAPQVIPERRRGDSSGAEARSSDEPRAAAS